MQVSLSINISRRPEEVFPWIDDPEKAMLWQKGVKGGVILHETAERVGTTFTETLEEDGQALEMTGRITAYEAGRCIAFHLESRIHCVDVSYTVDGVDGGSTVQTEAAIHWKFPMNMVSLLMGGKMKEGITRQTQAELAELKRLCEAGA